MYPRYSTFIVRFEFPAFSMIFTSLLVTPSRKRISIYISVRHFSSVGKDPPYASDVVYLPYVYDSSATRAGTHGYDYDLRFTTTITAVGGSFALRILRTFSVALAQSAPLREDLEGHCGEYANRFGRCD